MNVVDGWRRLFFILIVLSTLSFNVFAKETPLSEEYLIARAIEALNESRYSKAETLLLRVLKVQPQNPEAMYYLALVYINTHRYDEAERLLKRASLVAEDREYIELELDRIYTLTGQCNKAISSLQRLIMSEDAAVSKTAAQLLDRCRIRGFNLIVYASLQYDTNVLLEPTNPPPQAPSGKSFKEVTYLDLSLRAFKKDRLSVFFRYNMYQSLLLKNNLTGFNIFYQRLNPFLELTGSSGPGTVLGLNLEYSYFGDDLYGRSLGGYVTVDILDSDTIQSSITYEYYRERFWDSPLFKDNALRSGHKNTLKLDFNYIGDPFGLLLTGAYEWMTTRTASWSYRGPSVGGTIYFTLGAFNISAGYEFSRNDYQKATPEDIGRLDRRHEFSLQITRNLGRGLMLIFAEEYTRNISSIQIYTYRRSITSLTLRMEVL